MRDTITVTIFLPRVVILPVIILIIVINVIVIRSNLAVDGRGLYSLGSVHK